MEKPDRPTAVRRQRNQLSFWVETPSRLFLLSGMQTHRIQFLVAMALLAFGTAQVSRAGAVGYPMLMVLVAWLCWVLWQASVKVTVEREFQRVTVQRRRFLGLMTYLQRGLLLRRNRGRSGRKPPSLPAIRRRDHVGGPPGR